MADILLTNAGVIAGLMLSVWLVSLPLRDVSIIDLVWGLGFVIVAWTTWLLTSSTGPSHSLVVLLVTIWGCRLSAYLAWRNHGQPEDRRYARMRENHGSAFPFVSLLTVFILQGVVMWVVALPIQLGIQQSQHGWTWLHFVGVIVWTIGFLFESIGDWQLAKFKARPDSDGKVLDTGLWRYTRHPNYFGDFCVCWGIFLIAIAGGAAWWSVIGPVVMSSFLLRVSGVTMLEKDIKDRRPQYEEYMQRTSTFFPWFPATGNVNS